MKPSSNAVRLKSTGNLPRNKSIPHLDERTFAVDKRVLKAVKWPFKHYIQLTSENVKDFVFVTAANNPYNENALDAIATVQEHFPGRKIIFYDLDKKTEMVWNDKVIVPDFVLNNYFYVSLIHKEGLFITIT